MNIKEQVNYFTKGVYQGKNAAFLALAKFKSNKWATYRQWLEGGYQVQKGEKGQPIMKIVTKDDTNERFPKYYRVFNFEQVKKIEKSEV